MQLHLHKHFKKEYQRLSPQIQRKADTTITKFTKNPQDMSLQNHALRGRLVGLRAISVTSNIRIIFQETNDYEKVVLLRIGTHNQVY